MANSQNNTPDNSYRTGADQQQPGCSQGQQPVISHKKPKKRLSVLSIITLCFCALSVITTLSNYSEATPSTHSRRPIAKISGYIYDYYLDEAGLIDSSFDISIGLSHFYNTTGVAPYIYVTDSIDGISSPTAEQLHAFAASLYDTMFDDEAHLLYVFFYTGTDYMDAYICGSQAQYVIDAEAGNILRDYIRKYYEEDSNTFSEIFRKAFMDAADRMMSETVSPWFVMTVCLLISAVVILFYIRRRKKQKAALSAKQSEQLENMLKIPLQKFEDQPEYDDEAERRARNYDDDPNNDIPT